MSLDLSENEARILSQLVARDEFVSDEFLLKATEIDPTEFDDAAIGLVKKGYAETPVPTSDPSRLRATQSGIMRASEL